MGKSFDASIFDWASVSPFKLLNCCVNPPRGRRVFTCGKILAHARGEITRFRESTGGVRLCVFKIGISANPILRFISYLEMGFTDMWVLTKSNSVELISMLEAACISHFSLHVGCRNQNNSGGEGSLNKEYSEPPFFLYVTGGRADQFRRIGG